MNDRTLLQITTPPGARRPFCAGLVLDRAGVVQWDESAPLLRRLLAGWQDVRLACRYHGWTIRTVRIGNRQPAPRTPW